MENIYIDKRDVQIANETIENFNRIMDKFKKGELTFREVLGYLKYELKLSRYKFENRPGLGPYNNE